VKIEEVPTERALFRRLQSLISTLDPDFLLGWEVRQGLVKQ
jgi:DNA polymerase elongation subunit (family B)